MDFPLKSKSDVAAVIKTFVPFVENMLSCSLKIFRSDGGGEFVNNVLHEYFSVKGIIHQRSCPYTPEQNGVAERKHRSIVDTALSLLYHASIPLECDWE